MPINLQPASLKYKNGNSYESADCIKGEGLPEGGTTGQIVKKKSNTDYDYEWGSETVNDVQIDGTSILNHGVANVPVASASGLGVVGINVNGGIVKDSTTNKLLISKATTAILKAGTNVYFPVVAYNQHESAFYGLAKAAGDATQSASSNAVGTYTDAAKVAIQKMLGVYHEWELIADVTVDADTAQLNITTDINGEAFQLSEMFVRAWLETSTTGANDYVSATNLAVKTDDNNIAISAPTRRYMSNGAKTYFEYTSKIMANVSYSTGTSASNPNNTSSIERISSASDYGVKYYYGFRLSQYSTGTLIPKDSVIKIYGIRI